MPVLAGIPVKYLNIPYIHMYVYISYYIVLRNEKK